jgi:HSP20 family molecular chaperone IbpA
MSPFGQLNWRRCYGRGIDTNFNPILHYIDEIDPHFSNHHRLMNCFIPRFDLEEDDRCYYLRGETPGAKAEDITIEPQDSHTLEISGSVHRYSTSHSTPRAEEIQSDENNITRRHQRIHPEAGARRIITSEKTES